MSTATALAAAVPVADVSPEHLRHVAWVRAFDPTLPGVATVLPVGGPGRYGSLGVLIDGDRRDEQIKLLRVMIRLAVCCG